MRQRRGAYAHGETCCLDEDRIDVGADCPLASMVRESCDCIIGDARPEAIPFGRLYVVSDSLRRHAYTVIVEGMMSAGQRSAKPAELSQLNLNAAGIDVGATSHFVAVPAARAEQPVQEFAAFTADLYRLVDWLTECGVQTVVMESTGVSAEMSFAYSVMVSDVDVGGRRVGGLSPSMYLLTVSRWMPNSLAMPRMDSPLRFASCILLELVDLVGQVTIGGPRSFRRRR